MPVVVAIAPFELLRGVGLGRGADVVIEVADVLDVGGEPDQFPLAVAIQTAFHDVAVVFVDHHRLGLQAVLDGAFDHHQIGTGAQRIPRVNATAVVHFSGRIVVAGRLVGAPFWRAHIGEFPFKTGTPSGEVRETHPIRNPTLEQDQQLGALRIVVATALVVVVVDGPLVGVVEVVHVAVIVDPQARVASRPTTAERIHAVDFWRKGPPLDIAPGGHPLWVVAHFERQGLIAGPSWGAIDGMALAVSIIATAFDQHVPIQPDLIEGVWIQAIAVGIIHGEDHAVFPDHGFETILEQRVLAARHIHVQDQVALAIGQGPGHLAGPGVGLNDHREGHLIGGTIQLGMGKGGNEAQQKQRQDSIQHADKIRTPPCLKFAPHSNARNPWDTTTTTTTTPKPNRTKSEALLSSP